MSNKSADNLSNLVDQFIESGGEVTKLKYASEKDVKKAQRKGFHLLKKDDSIRSNEVCERERARESTMVFSRTDRWRK